MNRTAHKRPHALLRALSAFLAFVLALSASGASMAAWWATSSPEGTRSTRDSMFVQSARDVGSDFDTVGPAGDGTAGWMDEEEQDDDPVADAPRTVFEISEESLAVVWERPDCERPVSDPDADETSPPPRARRA
ncbi:hypothetical protein [Pendulispora albinea]|uniref:Secreted protein n=1 Tax=Pendulispora albinea TaxID=2741071 RepID=A0ABZ2LVK3_9BACT